MTAGLPLMKSLITPELKINICLDQSLDRCNSNLDGQAAFRGSCMIILLNLL